MTGRPTVKVTVDGRTVERPMTDAEYLNFLNQDDDDWLTICADELGLDEEEDAA